MMIKIRDIVRAFCVMVGICGIPAVVLVMAGCSATSRDSSSMRAAGELRSDNEGMIEEEAAVNAEGGVGSSETYSRNHPGMLFPSKEMISMLSKRGLPAGFDQRDWEYSRNDYLMGMVGIAVDPFAFSEVFITQDETLYESNGRPIVYGRQRIRSIRTGRGY